MYTVYESTVYSVAAYIHSALATFLFRIYSSLKKIALRECASAWCTYAAHFSLIPLSLIPSPNACINCLPTLGSSSIYY